MHSKILCRTCICSLSVSFQHLMPIACTILTKACLCLSLLSPELYTTTAFGGAQAVDMSPFLTSSWFLLLGRIGTLSHSLSLLPHHKLVPFLDKWQRKTNRQNWAGCLEEQRAEPGLSWELNGMMRLVYICCFSPQNSHNTVLMLKIQWWRPWREYPVRTPWHLAVFCVCFHRLLIVEDEGSLDWVAHGWERWRWCGCEGPLHWDPRRLGWLLFPALAIATRSPCYRCPSTGQRLVLLLIVEHLA